MVRTSALALLLLCLPVAGNALDLEDCRISAGPGYPGIKARCGTFERPLDPASPGGEMLELRVAVVPALDLTPEPDPLVPLAGGPGGSAIQFYSAYAGAFEPVRRTRDILLIDQRGTGDSAHMDCPIDDDIVEGQYTEEETIAFTQSCLDQLPHDPRFFTTSVAVADLEALREALGYPALNLLGTSYGSRVAQHFARRYPDSTRTVVIDGVVPPQLPLGPGIALEAQRAIDEIFARCAEDVACNERFPEIDLDFAALRAELENEPVMVSLLDPATGRPTEIVFGRNELAGAVRLLAYQPQSIAILPLMIHEAANGNLVPLAAQFQMTMTSLADALALGMHNSVMCTEDLPFLDRDAIDFDALEKTYIGAMQLEALDTICSVWPRGPIDDDFNEPLATNIPVLLLSGTADPITPPSYAEMALVEMTNHTHIANERQGHGQVAAGCMPDVIASFVASADPAALDASCMERAFIMPFFVDFSGPQP
ncbi:MAG: alpha/beta fold hydrolase [Woeseiaceae bacterium]|nr:alpha/beta fold hydrolase [Woeseiaceae bacterium]